MTTLLMNNIKEKIESQFGEVSNEELYYAIQRLESIGFLVTLNSPDVIFDRVTTFIDEYRRLSKCVNF